MARIRAWRPDQGGAPNLTGPAKATQRSQEHDRDEQMHGQGVNPRPTRAPLQARPASPGQYASSGMEQAMGALADKLHPTKY